MENFNLIYIPIAGIAAYTLTWAYNWISTPTTLKPKTVSKKSDRATKYSYQEIPGPSGLPIFGSLLSFVSYVYRKRGDLFFTDIQRKYGSIARFNVLGQNFIVICDAKMLKTVFGHTREDIIRDDSLEKAAEGILEYALFSLQSGPVWRKHRRALQPAFGLYHLREALDICVQYADELIELWDSVNADGTLTRNIHQDVHTMSGDVMSKFALGAEMGALKQYAKDAKIETIQIIEYLSFVFCLRINLVDAKLLWPLFGASTKQCQHAVTRLNEIVRPFIDKKREKIAEMAKTTPDWDSSDYLKKDLLDRLVLPQSVTSSTSSLTDEEIAGEVVAFYAAGQETTTMATTWVIRELCINPDIQETLRKEINDSLNGNPPTLEILPTLKYLDAVVKETMRCHPILSEQIRVAANPIVLTSDKGDTFDIPKGCAIILNSDGAHHEKRYWGEDVNVFNPSRWLADDFEASLLPGAYTPFGDGPFVCIGQKLSQIEIKTTVIRILQKYRLKPSSKQGPIIPVHAVSMGIQGGLTIEVEKL
ncbi:hypothetical protein HK098_002595 [Nowakowskiella sp. JEL0407]|nr:hypothetical protein HK098_002595 [Nowakowskiella sp. JEL0407]